MKRLIILVLPVLAVALLVLGATSSKQPAEFSELVKKYYAAWNTLDPDNAASLYAKDADLVFFDVAPLKYSHGWKEYRDYFKTNLAPTFASLALTANDDLKVTRKGDMALTTLTFHAAVKHKDGSPLEFDGRHSIVWEKRSGEWLIIHEHVSKPL